MASTGYRLVVPEAIILSQT